ncbi:MFS transporter [Altericroceibacterium xinjiangense]|uniref:MFS transporter n=1 Tax=Altericroceibacterium xinjiangense TaxID=762261 RepID=UPI000F7F02AB|nr:MFS transporter [Altericroceibacterium xinjiangense]
MAVPFSEAVSRAPLRPFQIATVAVCMLVLICDGIDMQLLGIVAPVVIEDFGVDRGTFGIAMSAALVGMGLGAWTGGWLGDAIGRRYSLAVAAVSFGLATIAASRADGVWMMAFWRLLGGLGFGAAYANALAMGSEWLPERWRAVAITTLSVGTPAGGAIAAAIAPAALDSFGWRGTFVLFGVATLLLLVLILGVLRDSPSFLLSKGRRAAAHEAAGKVLRGQVDLIPERDAGDAAGGGSIGVLHRSNLRLNLGVGISFAASTLVAYGILNWSTTFLTAAGFALEQAAYAVSVAGITSILGAIGAGLLTRHFGSRIVMAGVSVLLFAVLVSLAAVLEAMPTAAGEAYRIMVIALIGAAAAVFSTGIATIYVVIALGYPQSCRSAGIGFGIFMGRIGAILASGFGGALIDWGEGSLIPFFAVLSASAILVSTAAFVINRHVPPARQSAPVAELSGVPPVAGR